MPQSIAPDEDGGACALGVLGAELAVRAALQGPQVGIAAWDAAALAEAGARRLQALALVVAHPRLSRGRLLRPAVAAAACDRHARGRSAELARARDGGARVPRSGARRGGGAAAGAHPPEQREAAAARVAARDGALAVLAGMATYAPRPWDVLVEDDVAAAAAVGGGGGGGVGERGGGKVEGRKAAARMEDSAAFCGALEYSTF